jgi:dTDP-4-dehydrorhamnose reductase
MPKLMITGSNGFLGQKLLEILKDPGGFEIIATSRTVDRTPSPGLYRFETLDITQKEAVAAFLAKHRPQVLIHTAAMTQVDLCENEKNLCWALNVHAVASLAEESEKYGTHFIHLSTDYIFDGKKELHSEDDSPSPLNYYGKSKWEAERIVQARKAPWSILRTILLYGTAPYMAKSNIVLTVKNNLEQKKPLRMATDQCRTATFVDDLAWACLEIAKRKKEGIFNISGGELISIYDLACLVAEVFELDPRPIQAVPSADLKETARRPGRSGFIIDKARREIEYSPRSVRRSLELLKQQLALKKSP